MAAHGLKRAEDGLEVFVMCEIPNNVIQIDAFCEIFDGVSIGSNDLTQLVLGVIGIRDRGRGLRRARPRRHRNAASNDRRGEAPRPHVGICGEAPANYPEIARFLVDQGIDFISVNPNSVWFFVMKPDRPGRAWSRRAGSPTDPCLRAASRLRPSLAFASSGSVRPSTFMRDRAYHESLRARSAPPERGEP